MSGGQDPTSVDLTEAIRPEVALLIVADVLRCAEIEHVDPIALLRCCLWVLRDVAYGTTQPSYVMWLAAQGYKKAAGSLRPEQFHAEDLENLQMPRFVMRDVRLPILLRWHAPHCQATHRLSGPNNFH